MARCSVFDYLYLKLWVLWKSYHGVLSTFTLSVVQTISQYVWFQFPWWKAQSFLAEIFPEVPRLWSISSDLTFLPTNMGATINIGTGWCGLKHQRVVETLSADWKSAILAVELLVHCVRVSGIEPPAHGLEGRCSIPWATLARRNTD